MKIFIVILIMFYSEYVMGQKKCILTDDVWNNCYGTYNYENGDSFTGIYVNDFPHEGKYIFSNGDEYIGEFNKDGKRHGQGTYEFSSGEKHVGENYKNKWHGQGIFFYLNGDRYEGEFHMDEIKGTGTFYFANGDTYTGEVENDLFHGQGKYVWGPESEWAGDIYVGEFVNDIKHGKGVYTYANGETIEGEWINDKFVEKEFNDGENIFFPNDSHITHASSGTGFAVSKNGYVITNYHVVEGCEKVNVHNQSKIFPSEIISYDKANDLALLKANFNPLSVLKLSDTGPELMQDIFVAGFPFGKDLSSSLKVTKGIVSSLTGLGNNNAEIQIDAAIQPGNSGGPIISNDGQVIAVTVASLDKKMIIEDFGVIPENTNFGIKINIVKNILKKNGVSYQADNIILNKRDLAKKLNNSTFLLSCLMTSKKN